MYNIIYKTNKMIDARFNICGSYLMPSKNITINLQLLSKFFKKEYVLINQIVKTILHEDLHKAITPLTKNFNGQEFIIKKIGY